MKHVASAFMLVSYGEKTVVFAAILSSRPSRLIVVPFEVTRTRTPTRGDALATLVELSTICFVQVDIGA